MEELWKHTSSKGVSVYEAKRKVDSVLFPEQCLSRRYRMAIGAISAVAASLAVALVLSCFSHIRYKDVNYAEVSTLSGQNTEVVLDDGTKVILNSHSKLIYPESFSGNIRKVFLTGEAVFDVAEDEGRHLRS